MKNIIETARKHMDSSRMLEIARDVAGFHRIQASTGFRASAEKCVELLKRGGIDAQILKYKSDESFENPASRPMLEWDMRAGACEVEGFGEIADYAKLPLSIICRSMPCDFRKDGLELVYLDKSADENDYADLDLKGKLVFVRGNILDYAWTWQKRGALGVVTDFVLNTEHHQDVVRYTSFWWNGIPGDVQVFGFTLTPSLGKKLAEFCIKQQSAGKKVIARGYVDSSHYSGIADTVNAFLPGETDEEILIVAHLCHPQPSANDNTSGVAAGIEAITALKAAVDCGDLPALKRGVRLLLLPEMRGTYDYLRDVWANHTKILAGINLDMVGARQDGSAGPLVLTMLPLAMPSFTEQAAVLALETSSQGFHGFNPKQGLPSVNHAFSVYSGGSDHYILSDPTVGIPTTMLGQWPDRFYHTSGDTIERLCPRVLSASGGAAFAFCAYLSNLSLETLPALLARGRVMLARRLETLGADERELATLLLSSAKLAASDCARFFKGGEANKLIAEEQVKLDALFSAFFTPAAAPECTDKRVPRRKYPMPFESLELAAHKAGHLQEYKEYMKDRSRMGMIGTVACYYMDGKRCVSEVIRLASLECGESGEALTEYINLLEKLNMVEFI